MNRAELASAICELAVYLRAHSTESLAQRRRVLMDAGGRDVSIQDLTAVLDARPDLIRSWWSYLEDQRSSDGWVLSARTNDSATTEWTLSIRHGKDPLTFTSQTDAFAALIARIADLPHVKRQPHGS
jgi:hypothetical protein